MIAPHGGTLGDGLAVQRTFGTGRSVEFDAVLVAGAAPPAPDALVSRDSKAGAADAATVDPRVVLLLEECFRHAKAIGAWGQGRQVLEAARIAGRRRRGRRGGRFGTGAGPGADGVSPGVGEVRHFRLRRGTTIQRWE